MGKSTTLTEARRHLGAIVQRAEHAGEWQIITNHGREVAAVVPIEDLRAFQKLQDELDHEAAVRSYEEVQAGTADLVELKDLPPISD